MRNLKKLLTAYCKSYNLFDIISIEDSSILRFSFNGICVNSGMVSGHTQAVDSVPVKANASMESVVLKVPEISLDNHLKKVSEENREATKKQEETISPVKVTAPEHYLKRVEKHHQRLRDSTVSVIGASHEKSTATIATIPIIPS